MAFLLYLVLQRVVVMDTPGCITVPPRETGNAVAYERVDMDVLSHMHGLQRTDSAASQPPRLWQPWTSDTVQPFGTLGNKLGVHYFNWRDGRDGVVRRVWISNTEGQRIRAKIVAFDARKMRDATKFYGGRYLDEAAQRTRTKFDFNWQYLSCCLYEIRTATWEDYIMFALLTDVPREQDILIGFAAGGVTEKPGQTELSFVETAPPFERQSVAKVLSTYVLMDAQRRGFFSATVSNYAGLPGILAYIPAAANAGFSQVRLQSQVAFRTNSDSDFCEPPLFGKYDNGIEVDDIELVLKEGEFDAVMRLCFKLLEQFALKGVSCTCTAASQSHCFNMYTHELTFTRLN